MKKDLVVVVDNKDRKIRLEEKIKAHLRRGILHRGFMVFVFDSKGRLLLQKRSANKMLWPLYWDCSCASHPRLGETYKGAGERRLKEELGFTCGLKIIDKFQYQSSYFERSEKQGSCRRQGSYFERSEKQGSARRAGSYKNIGSENEICTILVGEYMGKFDPNFEEISDWKWQNVENLSKDIRKHPDRYTPWLKIGIKRLRSKTTA